MERDPNARALRGEGAEIAEVAIGESAEDNVGLAPTVEILRGFLPGTPLVPLPRIRATVERWWVAPSLIGCILSGRWGIRHRAGICRHLSKLSQIPRKKRDDFAGHPSML